MNVPKNVLMRADAAMAADLQAEIVEHLTGVKASRQTLPMLGSMLKALQAAKAVATKQGAPAHAKAHASV